MSKIEKTSRFKYVLESSKAGIIGFPISNLVLFFITFVVYLLFKLIEKLFPERYGIIEEYLLNTYKISLAWSLENPEVSLTIISVLGLFWLFVLYYKNKREKKELEEQEYYESDLIRAFGALHFSDRATEEAKKSDWGEFVKLIGEEKHNNTLRVLGASGWETFGSEDSPLHDLIQMYPGKVQVLILDQKAEAIKDRANTLPDCNVTTYRNEAKKSYNFINGLTKNTGSRIRIETYDHAPSWKMIITDHHLWVQYYTPNCHITDSSVHIFYQNNDQASLFTSYRYEFDRLWEEAIRLSES